MKKLSISNLGWLVAGAMAVTMATGAFQGQAEKTAVVDIAKVVEDSDYGRQNQDTFRQMKASRESILEFMDVNRVMTIEQADRFRELSLKPNLNAEEKASLETLKREIQASDAKYKELITKTNLSPEERNLMQEYVRRGQATEDLAGRWFREFTNELQAWADQQKAESLKRARTAIEATGKAGGYTIVFEVGVAPYGANDITAEALKAMNASR